jgi:hypothetical protein
MGEVYRTVRCDEGWGEGEPRNELARHEPRMVRHTVLVLPYIRKAPLAFKAKMTLTGVIRMTTPGGIVLTLPAPQRK